MRWVRSLTIHVNANSGAVARAAASWANSRSRAVRVEREENVIQFFRSLGDGSRAWNALVGISSGRITVEANPSRGADWATLTCELNVGRAFTMTVLPGFVLGVAFGQLINVYVGVTLAALIVGVLYQLIAAGAVGTVRTSLTRYLAQFEWDAA